MVFLIHRLCLLAIWDRVDIFHQAPMKCEANGIHTYHSYHRDVLVYQHPCSH